ncbi:hypothetical protein FRC98_03525 [Lujinxingia vulgaris]|uniref:G domain-containing protein n=1 Tax=Lujinxingia vulgaris TaxID=2600176 RepID=A0A5C6XQ11_9DELT|nr:GTPase [Lujinxingia vulgaris]TXD39479.1 hypothetical protein FRC98_03525 [Lujinxingia vulgaris]
MTLREELTEQVVRIEEMLEKVPEPMARKLREHLGELRELLLEQRPPRFVLVGRRGAGKSSLVNAIFGEPVAEVGHEKATTARGTWWSYEGGLGTLEMLDTRGLQEGSAPEEASADEDAQQSIARAIEEKAPDALLFLIKAKEIDAAVDGDLDGLEVVSQQVRERYGYRVPLVAVITHCDELEPKNVNLHAPDDEDADELQEKLARVRRVEQDLAQKIRGRTALRDQLVGVHGVSAYQSWRRDGTRRADERWRVEELLDFLLDELPEQARVEFVRLSQVRGLQHRMADRLTTVVSGITAGVALTPLPLADIGPITSLQVSLVVGIGYVAGRRMELRTAGEFLGALGANVGAAMALREVARGLVKVMPGFGSVVSAAVAFAGTRGVGRASAAYFIDGVSTEQAKELFKKARRDARAEYEREHEE